MLHKQLSTHYAGAKLPAKQKMIYQNIPMVLKGYKHPHPNSLLKHYYTCPLCARHEQVPFNHHTQEITTTSARESKQSASAKTLSAMKGIQKFLGQLFIMGVLQNQSAVKTSKYKRKTLLLQFRIGHYRTSGRVSYNGHGGGVKFTLINAVFHTTTMGDVLHIKKLVHLS